VVVVVGGAVVVVQQSGKGGRNFGTKNAGLLVGGVTCSHDGTLRGTENASHVLITTSRLSNSLDSWI